MVIIRRGQKLYLYRRVPRRFADLDQRTFVYLALGTEDTAEAKEKAPKVWRELVAGWEAKLAGHDPDAMVRFEAARELAAARGYRYRTCSAQKILAEARTKPVSTYRGFKGR